MKRSIALLVCATFLCCIAASGLVAQAAAATGSAATEKQPLPGSSKDLYVKTIYIMKVYPHSLGYRVDYLTSSGFLASTYLPLSWFSGVGNKGEMISEYSSSVPYMELVFDGGKFKMVRLHVSPNYTDKGWGSLRNGTNIDDKFKVEAPELVY